MKIVLVSLILVMTIILDNIRKTVSTDPCLDSFIEGNRDLDFQMPLKKSEKIEYSYGDNVKLNCTSPIRRQMWHFLPCSTESHYQEHWQLLNSTKSNRGIENKLILRNLNKMDSGFYRCAVHNKVIKMYKLVINSNSTKMAQSVISTSQIYNELSYTEMHVKVGDKCTLKCNDTSEIILEFLPCFPNKNAVCKFDSTYNEKTVISPSKNVEFLNNKVKMFNLRKNQSGLYRCVKNKEIFKTYNIQITDSTYDGPLPKILEVRNSGLLKDSFILMKCLVYSKLEPSINWLKECDETSYDLEYLGKFYQSINRSEPHRMPFEDFVFYGEIRVKVAKDVENYVCLTMTQFGKDYEILNIDFGNNERELRALTLFLIPLSLILVPILVWLCYFKRKKRNSGYNGYNICNDISSQIPLMHKLKTVCGNK